MDIMPQMILIVTIFLACSTSPAPLSTENLTRMGIETFRESNIVVWFDPYVSIKDTVQPVIYSESTLIPLLEKVGTRFSQIMIHLSEDDLVGNRWSAIVSETVANLNKLKKKGKNSTDIESHYLKIWISFHYVRALVANKRLVRHHLNLLSEMCAKANSIFPGTVHSIEVLLPAEIINGAGFQFFKTVLQFLHRKRNSYSSNHTYKLGVMYGLLVCRKTTKQYTPLFNLVSQYTDFVVFDAVSESESHVTNMSGNYHVQDIVNWLLREMNRCQLTFEKVFRKKPFRIGFITGWPDTINEGTVNFTNLVTYWQSIAKMARRSNVTFVMDRAFDTPYSFYKLEETRGWWRLRESLNYASPSEYIFEEKAELIKSVKKVHKIKQVWMNSYNEHVGIMMASDISNRMRTMDTENETEMISKISKIFKRLLVRSEELIVSDEENSKLFCGLIPQLAAELNHNLEVNKDNKQTKLKVALALHSTNADIVTQPLFNTSLQMIRNCANNLNKISDGTVDLMLFRLDRAITWDDESGFIAETLSQIVTSNSSIKAGVILPLKCWCLQETNLSLAYTDLLSAVAITAEVNWLRLTSDADRFLQQFIILLDICRTRVITQFVSSLNSTNILEMLFIVEWTELNLDMADIDKLESFRRFWDGLSMWTASQKHTTLILGDSIDLVGNYMEVEPNVWWNVFISGNKRNLSNAITTFKMLEKKKITEENKLEPKTPTGGIPYKAEWGIFEILSICFTLLTALMSLVVLQVYFWKKSRQQNMNMSRDDNSVLGIRSPRSTNCNSGETTTSMSAEVQLASVNYLKAKYETSKDHFSIDKGGDAHLGEGEFAIVRKGTLHRKDGESVCVAVKMAKISLTTGSIDGILSEIKVLSYIGKHDNIVELLGAYTVELHRGIAYIFLELCLGSLHSHLKNERATMTERSEENVDYSEGGWNLQGSEKLDPQLSKEFYGWAIDIANGMKFLASKYVVHADLASRNVLLSANRQAKITDFGLSRRMYNYQCYVKAGKEALPWRWMAPESLRFSTFTEKSDVWAYGVTLWEIYSLGETPYSGISWDLNFSTVLEKGLRLSEPKFNENLMYSQMLQCWSVNPAKRPRFSDILVMLENRKNKNKIE